MINSKQSLGLKGKPSWARVDQLAVPLSLSSPLSSVLSAILENPNDKDRYCERLLQLFMKITNLTDMMTVYLIIWNNCENSKYN